ncbi:MAG: TIGR00730 family Rossman fold protein [Planctomycetes bacterium]|nr:TIGR00730 family Rossman fold protein [Planctomycetota bacterium]
MKRVCVFCGSSPGRRPAYVETARALGRLLAARGIGVVYGGASIGVMGAVADGALEAGGEVIGVIPERLAVREVSHDGLTAMHVVKTMHERKAMMADLSDAFVALPGGIGTFEELFEVWTWGQLGMHRKPCALLDVEDYYAPLRAFIAHSREEGFLRDRCVEMLLVATTGEELLERLVAWQPVSAPQWIDRDTT